MEGGNEVSAANGITHSPLGEPGLRCSIHYRPFQLLSILHLII